MLGVPDLLQQDHAPWLKGIGDKTQSPTAAAGISAAVGVMIAQWWRPCVGVGSGPILTGALREQ